MGQNLESIGKEKPITLNGGISLNQILYLSSDSLSSRQPYTYYLNGNLNLSIYGWSVPVSFSFSNRKFAFTQPFNQYSIHPTYKWVTFHAGYTSMVFSPYTLNGYQFLGAGVEMNPGKYHFSAMYGRMQKAVELDTANTAVQPSYKRLGFGVKVGADFERVSVNVSAFHSKDEANSLYFPLDTLEIYPEQNIAFGAGGNLKIVDGLSIQAEYGSSMITRNTRSDSAGENLLINKRTSTEQFNAIKGGIKYAASIYSIGLTYERIDPGYRTHGAYYFNNDLENIAVNINLTLFNNKLNLGANVGIQRDDLSNKKVSNMLRIVNSYNVGFVPSEKINVSATYSNFRSHTNIKSQFEQINQLTSYDNLDTLNFTQIAENTSLNFNYTLASTEKARKSIIFNGMYQQASEFQQQVETNNGAKFMSLNAAYNYSILKTNTSITAAINYNNSKTSTILTQTIGPTINFRKTFLKNKIKSSLSVSYNNSYSNSELINALLSIRTNFGYSVKKKHVFSLGTGLINRNSNRNDRRSKSTEFTGTLAYAYNF